MRKVFPLTLVLVFSFLFQFNAAAQADPPLLLRYPTLSKTQIVFNYGGDLWIVSRDGGDARRLTSGIGTETDPFFSPDGAQVAFTGEYDGNVDVYVVSAAGGEPRRLTYHPADEYVLGWTPDGKNILFMSWGNSFRHFEFQLYTVPVEGGFPTQLPIAIGAEASYSPDGSHLAYVPHIQWEAAWKRYHGGQTTPIWIADLKDSSIVKVPRENSNDHYPMWIGDTVYFLSDRNGPVSLFAYDTKSKQVSEALHSDGLDFKTASAGPDAIVIEQFGAIRLYDLKTHQAKNISIHVAGDIDAVRPHFAKVDPKRIQNFNLSPRVPAPSLRPGERSSPCPPIRATFAISLTLPPSLIAIPHGLPTENRSPIFPTSRENTDLPSAIKTAWVKSATSTSAIRRHFSMGRPGRPTARKLPTPINACNSGMSISISPRRSSSTPIILAASAPRSSTKPGRPTASGLLIRSSSSAVSTLSSSIRLRRASRRRSPTA